MIKPVYQDSFRHHNSIPFMNQEMSDIVRRLENETKDKTLAQSLYIGPTALTHIKRIMETGGSFIFDTTLLSRSIHLPAHAVGNVRLLSFIDDMQVMKLAEQRHITRAEIAVDYGLAVSGPKLMIVGSAPSAINRLLMRRTHEPMSDVCVLAAPSGFASVVQLKERLIDSDLSSIVLRGKQGGIPATIAVMNSILQEISRT